MPDDRQSADIYPAEHVSEWMLLIISISDSDPAGVKVFFFFFQVRVLDAMADAAETSGWLTLV